MMNGPLLTADVKAVGLVHVIVAHGSLNVEAPSMVLLVMTFANGLGVASSVQPPLIVKVVMVPAAIQEIAAPALAVKVV